MTGESTEVSQVNELKDGTMKIVVVQGQQVLLARVGDKYYAASNRCPHMGGD
ncbi:Rieske (2Fe-2S) protein [Chloroflexota bacterium]